jgi:hypothetical protein
VWLPPSRISSLSGPNPTIRCADYAQLLKTLCLALDAEHRLMPKLVSQHLAHFVVHSEQSNGCASLRGKASDLNAKRVVDPPFKMIRPTILSRMK